MNSVDLSHEMVASYVRTDTILLHENAVIQNVIDVIRKSNISDQITYFYVTDQERRLIGVLPIRRLLSAPPGQAVREVMLQQVLSLSADDTLAKAQRMFSEHKYLAFPVIDNERIFLGVLDITVFTGKGISFAENHRFDVIDINCHV